MQEIPNFRYQTMLVHDKIASHAVVFRGVVLGG